MTNNVPSIISFEKKKPFQRNNVSIYVFKSPGKKRRRQKVTKIFADEIFADKVIRKSSPRTVEAKPDSLYMIHNLLYETKVTVVTNFLKAHVKIRSFSMGYCKHGQKKFIISYKTSVG